MNDDVKSEGEYTDEACDEIRSTDYPDIPILYLYLMDPVEQGKKKEPGADLLMSLHQAARMLKL